MAARKSCQWANDKEDGELNVALATKFLSPYYSHSIDLKYTHGMASHRHFNVGAINATLEDVLRVAQGLEVAIDPAASARIKKESPAPKSFEAEPLLPPSEESPSTTSVAELQSRAAIFVKLNSLVNGHSKVRLSVLECLVALLNFGLIPCVPRSSTDEEALQGLVSILKGAGCLTHGATTTDKIPDALQSMGIQVPHLNTAEREAILAGHSVSAGIGALCIEFAHQLLHTANATAALSAEALQADIRHLDADIIELYPSKSVIESAAAIRAFTEGSKQVNAKKVGAGVVQSLIAAPQAHGALSDAITAASAPVKAEVAAGALPPDVFMAASPTLACTLVSVGTAALRVAALSLDRADITISRVPDSRNDGKSNTEKELDVALGVDPADITSEPTIRVGLEGTAKASRFAAEQAHTALLLLSRPVAEASFDLPTLAAARAAYDAVLALQHALTAEAMAACVSIKLQQGPSARTDGDVESANSTEGGKNKKKKKNAGEAGGVQLGKGTQLLQNHLINTIDSLAAQLGLLTLEKSEAAVVREAEICIGNALDPSKPHLKTILSSLQSVLEANAGRRKPKIPKGCRDFFPDQMAIREVVFSTIMSVFKRHGAVSIDTPVFELRETLTGKYGEDSKLIYDLADQGGEALSLRYDLTVPFARYVALHGVAHIKRYHIAKVYRRDQPQMNRGRFREFFQCDFDIAGAHPTMTPDSEVISVLVEILRSLDIGDFEIKLSHRKLLDGMFEVAGVPAEKFRTIGSAVDKLDKEPWTDVRAEMVDEKGLDPGVADRIGEFVQLRGEPRTLLQKLMVPDHPLMQHSGAAAALSELILLFEYLDVMGVLSPISFDLSLARGLDYYTGVIYEAVLKGAAVGSVAAGGRYDHLVGQFSGKEVPCVGVSIGVERVFSIMEGQWRKRAEESNGTIRETETEVYVASIGSGLQSKRMAVASLLWKGGIKTEYSYKPNPKMGDQLGTALKAGIPFMIVFGENEVAKGVVKVKDMDAGIEEEVAEQDVVEYLKPKLALGGERRIVASVDKD